MAKTTESCFIRKTNECLEAFLVIKVTVIRCIKGLPVIQKMLTPNMALCTKVTENMNYLRNFLHFHLICFESISLQTIPY